MKQNPDIVELVEHLYRVDLSNDDWQRGIVEATRKVIDFGLGVNTFTYAIDASMRMTIINLVASFRQDTVAEVMTQLATDLSGRYVAGSYGSLLCSTASETPGFESLPSKKLLNDFSVEDVFGVNGIDPSGRSAFIGVPSPTRVTISHAMRARWERIAAHLAASHRLRNRLEAEQRASTPVPLGAEAILSPSGRIEHAEEPAQSKTAQTALREGVESMERARGPQRRSDPDRSVAEWKGLIAARWTLVEVREVNGRRYLVACENENIGPRISVLTARERQVAVFASMGYPHKLIGYHLGIDASTSRVLCVRALKKLGLSSREQLVALFSQAAGQNAPGAEGDTPG